MDRPELELVMTARQADLPGGLRVQRAIPQAQRRSVGPFVFLDLMGPTEASEIAVLPHPHIGLSTLTFLFEGEGLHRDSLGTVQKILPGEVNWMTAGRGVAHSERLRRAGSGRMFGVQLWVALPQALEESDPRFDHYGSGAVAQLEEGGMRLQLIAGELLGARSEVQVSSPLFCADVRLEEGAVFKLPPEHAERGAFVIEGSVGTSDGVLKASDVAFFRRGGEVLLQAREPSRLLVLGGEPLEGPRYISWNFVSSSRERLKQAASDWKEQKFARVPEERSFIPLPEEGHEPVNYP
jgi:redox-sensitive bicupin YhaK (pirin superfamily)